MNRRRTVHSERLTRTPSHNVHSRSVRHHHLLSSCHAHLTLDRAVGQRDALPHALPLARLLEDAVLVQLVGSRPQDEQRPVLQHERNDVAVVGLVLEREPTRRAERQRQHAAASDKVARFIKVISDMVQRSLVPVGDQVAAPLDGRQQVAQLLRRGRPRLRLRVVVLPGGL
jgi:hypothetical protein